MNLLHSVGEDIHFAFRMMKRSLGLTAMAVLSLALGIGATIAIFSVIYALALRSLPVQRPDQLVEVARGDEINLHSYAEWKLFRDKQNVFSDVLAYNRFDTDFYIGPANQQAVSGLYVSGDYFRTLGAPAVLEESCNLRMTSQVRLPSACLPTDCGGDCTANRETSSAGRSW